MSEREGRSWGQAKRFEFIEWRLFWIGKLNRRDIETQFGISTPQASIDLRNYQEIAPGNLVYDSTAKAFVRGGAFSPQFLKISGDRYLMQMRALHTGAMDQTDTWFANQPEIDVVPQLARNVRDEDIRTVISAVSNKTALIVTYRSMTNTRQRMIGPHALAYDGFRWHLRAWCFENHEFKDFSLTRLVSVASAPRKDFNSNFDVEWHTMANLIICPHPDLNIDQKETIELDYGMANGFVEIEMRLSLAYYFIRRNNLDPLDLPANRQQIILSNFAQIEELTEHAKAETRRLLDLDEIDN